MALLVLQTQFWELLGHGNPLSWAVLFILVSFSLFSLTIIFSRRSAFRAAQRSDAAFLRAFRKSSTFDAAAAASEQFRPTPLVAIFDRGFNEVNRQATEFSRLSNKDAISRTLQVGASEQIARLEQNLNWLATTASVSPFIGLFGTVLGIIGAFEKLGAGSSSIAAVGPGIAEALIATAAGLGAAIPAAIAYNYFGRQLQEMGDRMDRFSMEFMNFAERSFGE